MCFICISKINNTQADNAKDINVVMVIYYRDKPILTDADVVAEMLLFNCEINLILTLSANCFIWANTTSDQSKAFTITDTKLSVPVRTLSRGGNATLLQQFKLGFKCTVNWEFIFRE